MQTPLLFQKSKGSACQLSLFTMVDCLKRMAVEGTRAGLDLHKDDRVTIQSDEVNLTQSRAVLSRDNAVTE